MTLSSERQAVQKPLVTYAEEAGWTYLTPTEALRLRRGEDSGLLHEVVVSQLQRLNPGVVDSARAGEIARRLARVSPTIEGNLEAWELLNGLKTVFVETEGRERNVRLLDAANPGANQLHVTDELVFRSGNRRIRADVVFFVNGVPILVVETKAATRLAGIAEALDQLRRYEREAPELMALLQLHALTHLIEFYYGATWNLGRRGLLNWRDEKAGDFETLVKSFVTPRRLLRVLADFILFARKDGELSKVVLYPHQMRAVERVVQRAADRRKRRGLIWHTQGSGKTFTMITVAKKLIEEPSFENPTVLMLVDRNELEEQLFANLDAVGLAHTFARSKRDLRHLLRTDRRGLIVSTIHKFEGIPADINKGHNVFVLVDEAHRSTGGGLGNYLMGALPNATYIGFTGTPIDRTAHGKGTFKVFGQDDASGYLDKYSIRESIKDGTTVPLHYALAPNDLQVDRAVLEKDFLNLAELEGVADVEELNRVLDRAVTLKNMLKNPARMARVAAFVADHFRKVVEPMGYKAFLVAPDREACALYKQLLDQHLPPEYSDVIISAGRDDPALLRKYHRTEDAEEAIRQAFRKPDELPKILIVTEKLLTGFDAPILYAMYLDKPMRDHVLLQAIARVNRPYQDAEGRAKPAGFILDFVGIFDKLERALAFDSDEVKGVVEGIEVLQHRFATLIDQGRAEYLPIWAGLRGDKAIEAVLEHFRDRAIREEFYGYFRELQELYDILSPDAFLRPFLDDYEQLVAMYRVVRGAYEPHVSVDKSFLRKTAALVQAHAQTTELREPREVYRLDEKTLEEIAGEEKPETVKVFNLVKAIVDLVSSDGNQAPYLIPIGERAEEIAERFKERQVTTQEALQELTALAHEYRDAEETRKSLNLSAEAFAIYWPLRRQGIAGAEDSARAIAATLARYPHWTWDAAQEREVRRQAYAALVKARIAPGEMAGIVGKLLANLRHGETA